MPVPLNAGPKARLWAVLGIVLLSLLWGYTWVVSKQALDFAPPFMLTFIRVLGGALALFAALRLLGQPLKLQAPRAVLLISLCQVSGFMLLQTFSLKFGAAGKTAVLVYTMPIWTLLLAWPMLGERVRGAQWLAVVGILGGLFLILEPWNLQAGWLSNSLGVGAAMCWAMGTVLVKKLRQHSDVNLLSLTAWTNLIGCIPVALIAAWVNEPPIRWEPEFIAIFLVLTLISTAFCWWLWTTILDRVPAWEASLLVLGTPVIAIISSRAILNEAFSRYEIAGILLIGGGLLLLSFASWWLERRMSSSQR
jgi:drug/metabolite transporter (DMT)-like permease